MDSSSVPSGAPPSQFTPPQESDLYTRHFTAPVDAADSDEWEYEYSSTETEVGKPYIPFS